MKKIKYFFVLFLMLLNFSPAQAQENSSTSNNSAKTILVATVNIYNAKIDSQDGNNFKISFDLSNRTGIQPDVKYAVDLVQKDGNDRILLDEKVYDEIVTLNENQTISKTIEYSAPQYANGNFEVWVISKNNKGLALAQNMAGEIKLAGNNQYLAVTNDSCYLTIQGDTAKTKYSLLQGVDVSPEETLIANCKVKNNFQTTLVAIPVFSLHYRSTFGQLISTQNGDALTFKPGETKSIALPLPHASQPQAYDAILTFQNDQGQVVSNSADFHYVLQGSGGTIQNLRLDKDYYLRGETAQAFLVWSGSASSFPDSRSGEMKTEENMIQISITNSQNQSCAAPIEKKTSELKLNTPISISIATNCQNPYVKVVLKDSNGRVLDASDYAIKSQNIPQAPVTNNGLISKNVVLAFFLVFTLAIILGIIIFYLKKKNKNNGTIVGIFLLILLSGLLWGSVSRADTVCPGQADGNIYDCMTININKSSYSPGETIAASGYMSFIACNNASEYMRLDATINNQTQNLISGGYRGRGGGASNTVYTETAVRYFTAPSVPASYQASFHGSLLNNTLSADGSIPYRVTQVCIPNQWDSANCRSCNGNGSGWGGDPGSDWGPNGGSPAWCSCARQYNMSVYNTSCCPPDPTCGGTRVNICPTDTCTDSCGNAYSGQKDCSMPSRAFRVSVAGSGLVVSNPAGINCNSGGGTCQASFASGTSVKLTATPNSGSEYADWSGDCSGSDANPCTLIMDADKNVSAQFDLPCNPVDCPSADEICKGASCDPNCPGYSIVNGTKECKDNWREVTP